MTHKEMAVAFLHSTSSGKAEEAFRKYTHPDFTHHNPYYPSDSASLMKGMIDNAKLNPHQELEVLRYAENDHIVFVHSKVSVNGNDMIFGLVHIFRFYEDSIIELWDIAQQVPKDSPNKVGMF